MEIELNNGLKMPSLGFGTWQLARGQETEKAVTCALKTGYRLIDTAKIYGNEESVGQAVTASEVPREDIFITTKLWNSDQGYDSALRAFDASLERLGLDYLDLYLIHWPATDKRVDSWKALSEIYKQGRAKSIGVSNFTVRHLQEIMDVTDVVPAVNQIEFHPFIYKEQEEILKFCQGNGIVVEAYSPLAHAHDMSNRLFLELAEKYHKSPAQLMLRWAIAKGTVPIPKSGHTGRIQENFEVFDFELNESDIDAIDRLSSGSRTTWDPTDMP
ncbi:MAG TPA: aldo/keto reductase [Candidatus Saccharimonadales bacterium]|nr:aldo/keto reductase [Candidatus Saccharimonadales bacterium]